MNKKVTGNKIPIADKPLIRYVICETVFTFTIILIIHSTKML